MYNTKNQNIMKPRHYVTAFLIFAALFLLCFSGNAQNSSDEIKVVSKGLSYVIYQNSQKLSFGQLMSITKENKEAYKIIVKASNLETAGVFFGIIGGGALGFSLGYALGSYLTGNSIEKSVILPVLGAGAVLTICSITMEVISYDNLRRGVDIYNKSIKQKNSTNLDLGFSPGGVMLKLNF
jgi:hypothetical protein